MATSDIREESRPCRGGVLDRVIAAALFLATLAGLLLAFYPLPGPYQVPWTDFKEAWEVPAFGAAAWILRATVFFFVLLLAARLVRLVRDTAMPARRRHWAVALHSILLGALVFAIWLPGRGDLADLIFLAGIGGLAVVLAILVLVLRGFQRPCQVEGCLAIALLLFGLAGVTLFLVIMGVPLLD